MASLDWHKMNNLVCEIERTTEKIINAKCHCMTNKNSIVKNHIPALEDKRNSLYDELYDHCTEWLKKDEVKK